MFQSNTPRHIEHSCTATDGRNKYQSAKSNAISEGKKKKKESSLFILLITNFSSSTFRPQFSSTNEELNPENSHLSQSLQRRHLHHAAIHYPTVVNQGSPPPKAPIPVQRMSDTADINLSFSTAIATNTSKSSQTPGDRGSE